MAPTFVILLRAIFTINSGQKTETKAVSNKAMGSNIAYLNIIIEIE